MGSARWRRATQKAPLQSGYLLTDNVRSERSVDISWSMHRGIDELAARFGFGVRNFKHRFKDAIGHTPLAYLQALRQEKAKELLEPPGRASR
jgi:AraC-like DNA-binding protein